MLQVLKLDEAKTLLKKNAEKIEKKTEIISLSDAFGRVLASDVVASDDLPPFHRSAVDGFAVSARDTFGASAALPALLRLAGEVKMGERAAVPLGAGDCAAVWTGGELPPGADAMVMLEDTQTLPGGLVAVEAASAPGRHVVFRGDDGTRGARVLTSGTRLFAPQIGLLAAFGCGSVTVFRRPRIHILSTGDELVDYTQTPEGAQMRDVNGPMLAAACLQAGAEAHFLGRVTDDEEALLAAMRAAGEDCDLLLLSGGSSAGAKDAAARCMERLGGVFFHGLAVKPGKPTLGGQVGDTLAIGLPGHPAAAYLVFHALVRPLVAVLAGESFHERTVSAALTEAVPSNHGREELLLVRLNGDDAEPVHAKSGLVSPLTRADGYARIPRETEGLAKGARVEVVLL